MSDIRKLINSKNQLFEQTKLHALNDASQSIIAKFSIYSAVHLWPLDMNATILNPGATFGTITMATASLDVETVTARVLTSVPRSSNVSI